MGKTVIKDTFREIKGSFGRFFAIFAIVAIGVSFFAGITASSSDMRYSSDSYYDEYNLFDLRLLSDAGFTDDDIKAIRETDGVKGVFAAHEADVLTTIGNAQVTVRVMGVPEKNRADDNEDYINRLRLKEGRLPERDGECVVRYSDFYDGKVDIGDTITLRSGDEKDISDTLKFNEYKVVGLVYTPYYASYDIGQSSTGSGKVNICIMVNYDCFAGDYYTETFVTVDGAKQLNTYTDKYFSCVDDVKVRLGNTGTKQIEARRSDIKNNIENERQAALNKVYDSVRESVREQIYSQYRAYYPGIDITSMAEPLVEPAVNQAIANLDLSEINDKFDKAENEALGSEWKWYVLDRNSHYSFRDYKSSADRMDAIAVVFPAFFILVAALVCLTTMTRMVDEQRGLIGTYKALGYGKAAIAMKFVLYSLMASLSGGIIGCIFGLKVFPLIIYNSWNIIYYMPKIKYANHIILSIIAIASMAAVIVAATLAACMSELSEVPSTLMRPKSPKKGKKILLEHIGIIWKHLSFSGKVTARNIFRYKKRFFMTVVGIAGGCALMLAGFAIKDSVSALIQKQFVQIIKYDATISYSDESVLDTVKADDRIDDYDTIHTYLSDVGNAEVIEDEDKQQKEDITIDVVENADEFEKFILLRKRNTNVTYKLDNDGICITEQLAGTLGVRAGDTIYLSSDSGIRKPAVVSHVVEMYTNSYIFMTAGYYEKVFGEEYLPNAILVTLTQKNDDLQNEVGSDYLSMDNVKGITFCSSNIEKFNNMISSINLVTYVLILSAAALTFVVLYNLINVNVSERIREIATIKVLGFFDKEVASYVYRENVVISIIGSLAGLILGRGLHLYIMKTIEMDNVMFGDAVRPVSYVYSFVLTMIFALFVNLVMYNRLRKVPMVESLKSVE